MGISSLDAISPLDGRYWDDVAELSPFVSEGALIRTRIDIECRYLVAMSNASVIRPLTSKEERKLLTLSANLSGTDLSRVKEIENTTKHDVKAVERALRDILATTSLRDCIEMIHFGLTSEDINNISQRLMLKRATHNVCIPALQQLINSLAAIANRYKSTPMLARTHGQPAVPTTFGKEIVVFAIRIKKQFQLLIDINLTAKLNGAVGNYNAHALAAPNIDWFKFSTSFIKSLGLVPNLYTTQINPYEDIIELFQIYQRINGIVLDLDQDMWRYISDGWLTQEVKKGEIGSSTMPQKVNPIRFENSEGNVQVANSLIEGLTRKLAVSRLQRDLSDSTTLRNMGVILAHSLLSYKNATVGLAKVHANKKALLESLQEDWSILAEAIQTILRKDGVPNAYTEILKRSQGKKLSQRDFNDLIESLPIKKELKTTLHSLTPSFYIGLSKNLIERALKDTLSS